MEQLDNITLTAVNRYFTHLSQFGYMQDNKVGQLLLLTFLHKLLDNYVLTEEQYNLVMSKINCLEMNSCLIPYESYIVAKQPSKTYLRNTPVRITQDDILRVSQKKQHIRLVNQ